MNDAILSTRQAAEHGNRQVRESFKIEVVHLIQVNVLNDKGLLKNFHDFDFIHS